MSASGARPAAERRSVGRQEGVRVGGAFELLSRRLLLRRLRPDDAAAICAYRSLPHVARYQSWESYTPDDAARLIAEQERTEPDTPGTWVQLALTTSGTGEVIGDCGIHFLAGDGRQ